MNTPTRQSEHDKQLETIESYLRGMENSLIHLADYMEIHGVMTAEEIKQIDKTRHMIASKVWQLTQ